MAFRNSESRGGGVLRTGNLKAWGDTYDWNSEGMGGGGVRSGIPTGDRQECIP